jgi:hypothetical protein
MHVTVAGQVGLVSSQYGVLRASTTLTGSVLNMYRALPVSRQVASTSRRNAVRVMRRVSRHVPKSV